MPDNNRIGGHRIQRLRRIYQGLALRNTTGRSRDIDDVRGEPFTRNFERGSSARRGFEEEIDYGLSPKGRYFLDGSGGNFLKGLGGIENFQYLFTIQILDSE